MARFVGFRWTPCVGAKERTARACAARLGRDWRTLLDWRGVLVLVHPSDDDPTTLAHGAGAIFGDTFSAGAGAFNPGSDVGASVSALAREWWGSYVALVIDRGHDVVRVLRSPDGAVPCYFAALDGVNVFFSDAADFIAMAPDVEPDLVFLAAFLCYPRVTARRTGLSGVEELAPGEALIFTREARRIEGLWSPARQDHILEFEQGMRAVRDAAERAVAPLTAGGARLLHRLSGGFDSSAVLGLLASQVPREAITCVNEFWPGAREGDEREIARTVAGRHGVELVELAMAPERVTYERLASAAPFSAKPTLAVLSFADSAAAEGYASVDADLLTSGQGGDHVFQRNRAASIAADAVREGLSPQRLLQVALDTAHLTRRSVWGVFETMFSEGVLGRRPPPLRRSAAAQVLQQSVLDQALCQHPWMDCAVKMPPARALRVWLLADALGYHDKSAITVRARPFPIVLSQPVVEACLRIPPYIMTQGGRDRALARAAFADLVPAEVERRTLKGETTRYFAAILAANRAWIADTLSSGYLANCAIIDSGRLTAIARADWREDSLAADGLYSLIAAEAWLQKLHELKLRTLRDQGAAAA